MKVSVGVCGKYHVLNYMDMLSQRCEIAGLYYSHKLNSANIFALNKDYAVNLFLKEYLTQGHGRLFGYVFYEPMLSFYSWLWESGALLNWRSTDLFHVLLQGAESRLVKKCLMNGVPVLGEVVNTHPENRMKILNTQAEKWGLKKFRKQLLQREINLIAEAFMADALLSPSEHVSQSYRDKGYTKPIYKIPFGVNTKRFDPDAFDTESNYRNRRLSGRLRIVSVGEVGLRKGQLDIVEAISGLGFAIDLTLVGVINPLVEDLISKFPVKINYLPRVESSQMPRMLSGHDIFLSASHEEGLALSVCEGMSMGLGVVATRESGATEMIEHMKSGIIYDAGDVLALRNSLTLLNENRDLLTSLGKQARVDALQMGGWGNYVDSLLTVYKQVVST